MAQKGYKLNKDGKVYKSDRKTFQNKDVYEGEFVGGKMHGFGVLTVHNGDKYTGEFVDNLFHGKGLYEYAAYQSIGGEQVAAARYEGYYVRGRKEGRGVYQMRNGDVYSGAFVYDLFHGDGILKTANGDVTKGSFLRGKASGKCIVEYANGDRYEGNMVRGVYAGSGVLTYRNDKGSYDGSWRLGKQHGQGVRSFVNGNKYIGKFFNGVIEGGGIMSFANGNQYAGDWKNGHMEGTGVFRFSHGDTYEGGFLRGFFFGQGKYTWADGGHYEGEYVTTYVSKSHLDSILSKTPAVVYPRPDGLRNGKGTRVWVNGARYDGDWQGDMMHGDGILTKAEGGSYTGSFWKGARHGMGIETFGNIVNKTFVCPMGHKHKGDGYCQYTGPFKLNYFEGEGGTFTCCDGRSYTGNWLRGKRHGKGTQNYVREGDMGDPKRLFIGGVQSLYRVQAYTGTWEGDKKQGIGEDTLFNNDKILGTFRHGLPDDLMLYKWAASPEFRERYVMYQRGQRVEWKHENTQTLRKLQRLMSQQSTFGFTLDSEDDSSCGAV